MTASPLPAHMMSMAALLKEHFGVNHCWYYKITNEAFIPK